MAGLKQVTEQLWRAPYDVFMPGGVHFPTHTAVICLADGLLLYSPGPVDDGLAAELVALGPVRWIVAPSALHHLHVAAAAARFPDAEVWVPPGLSARTSLGLPAHQVLTEPPAAWGGALELLRLDGVFRGRHPLDEVCLFHRDSGTLVVCDLAFNLHQWQGWQMSLVMRLVGTYKRFGQSRLWRLITRDRAAARASVEQLLQWPIERVVPCHGDVVAGPETADQLAAALWWMRGATPGALPRP